MRLAFALALLPALAAPQSVRAHDGGMVEQTYLKAEPGARAALARYIEANWFAMDRRATEEGWFTQYSLHENADSSGDWDLVVSVHYASAEGYADPATQAAFEAIRRSHREVTIDGRSLAQLGRIVRHQRLRPVVASAPSDRSQR